jgi:hypothetical protein
MQDNEGLDCDNQDCHNDYINYICIDQSCKLNRQACWGCLNRHQRHNIYTIDK